MLMVTAAYAVTRIQFAGATRCRNHPRRFRSRSTQSSPCECVPAVGRRLFRSHTERTGTRELESKNEAIIEKPTASESGTKSERETPVMKKEGTNTATTESM